MIGLLIGIIVVLWIIIFKSGFRISKVKIFGLIFSLMLCLLAGYFVFCFLGIIEGLSYNSILRFYVLFESLLIPMFLLIGMWGSRERRLHAAYQFFIYTLIGSLLMLLGIIIIWINMGSTDMVVLSDFKDYDKLTTRVVWFVFFVALSVKIPMVPVHLWLPEAHVEAPTGGSVLLAGILLKMGG